MRQANIKSWRQAFLSYTHPRVIGVLFLGFSAGLPYVLVFWTLSTWLREAGVSRSAIGLISWAGITFSIKFLWAPVVDRLPLPWLDKRLGRRRSWMLAGQLGIIAGIIGIACANPAQELYWIVFCAVLIAFASATQDISIDAYRIEAVDKTLQATMAAVYILGYRIAALTAGAGALYIAEFVSWPSAYFSMAVLMGVGVLTVLIVREPQRQTSADDYLREQRVIDFLQNTTHRPARYRNIMAWFIGAVVCPFVDFFSRNGKFAVLILLLIAVYRLSDITLGVMANTFYIDMGFSKTEIADISKIFGVFMTITGAIVGGVVVARYGIMRPLLVAAILTATVNLLFAYLATQGHDVQLLAMVICADNISGGMANTVLIAYLASLTNTSYTATQYALFNSLMTLPPKLFGGLSGIIVDAQGYVFFFCYAAAIGLPAIILVYYLLRLEQRRAERA